MNTIVVFLTFIVAAVNANSIGDWSSDVVADKWRIQAKNNIDAVLRKKRNTNIYNHSFWENSVKRKVHVLRKTMHFYNILYNKI